jgi:hypothetical protein
MCQFVRVPLIAIWSLRKQEASRINEGGLTYPEATGKFVPYCLLHRCQVEIQIKEFTSEERWVCPQKPDAISEEMKAELKAEKRNHAEK